VRQLGSGAMLVTTRKDLGIGIRYRKSWAKLHDCVSV